MSRAGSIVYETLRLISSNIIPGVPTGLLNDIAESYIYRKRATPSFKGYNGFPKSICISINDVVIHGIASKERLCDGDIVSVDVGAQFEGYHADAARTFACGRISPESQRLIDVTKQSFYKALLFMKEGNRVSDISKAIQQHVEDNGFSVVRQYCGHGIGKDLHEAPEIPNYVDMQRIDGSARLYAGMTLAVEPMVNMGRPDVYVMRDKWTVLTCDAKRSAHYENTVLITKDKPIILTEDLPHMYGSNSGDVKR